MLNDKDMDVLIRRYAKGAAKSTSVEHPDADELNAFAEGALPPAARQRYLSHFADCDDCRKLVSQLAVTTGAGVEARLPASEPVAEPWWKKLGPVFAIPTLRYAAFAVVLLAVGGTAFLVWRQPARRDAEMIAQNQPQTNPAEALKPATSPEIEAHRQEETRRYADAATAQPTVTPGSDQDKSGLTTLSPPPPKDADALAAKESVPVVTGAARADDTARAQSTPSYAPPPPAETYGLESRGREQSRPVGTGATPGGPRRNETYDKSKTVDRAGDFAKARDEVTSNRVATNQPSSESKQEDLKRARTESQVVPSSPKSIGESRVEARKSEDARATSEAPETRSAGGRKFKRQGNVWVDSKLKSSMSVRSISRGSEEFDRLDSGLRSIAKQLSGEIVVVWKGKAYRIR